MSWDDKWALTYLVMYDITGKVTRQIPREVMTHDIVGVILAVRVQIEGGGLHGLPDKPGHYQQGFGLDRVV